MVTHGSARGLSFADIVDSAITDARSQMDGLDFLDSPQGPRIHLLPVQRFLFKCIVGIPLDKKEGMIPVWDSFREKVRFTLSERDYLKFLYTEQRINYSDWRDLPPEGFNEVLAICGRRAGKALGMDTLIPTPKGWVHNKDLQTGDEVFRPDGTPVRILKAHEPFESEAYRVTFDDGTSVIAHGGHLWYTQTRRERKNSARWKDPATKKKAIPVKTGVGAIRTTEEIRATLTCPRADGKRETNHSVMLTEAVQLPERELPVDPYFLGLWLGDGHSTNTAVTTEDPETVEYLYGLAASSGLAVTVANNGSSASSYHLVTPHGSPKGSWGTSPDQNPLRSALRALGVWGNKHIPEDYLWASAEQRLALLQGLMDSDGCCVRGACEFSNCIEAISRGVYHLAASLGLKPTFSTTSSSFQGRAYKPRHRVCWTGGLRVFRLPRKLEKLYTEFKPSQSRRYIVAVEPVGVQQVRCITVDDPAGLFLFGENFNVTHNSFLVSALAVEKLRQLLTVRNPHEVYRIAEGDPIDFTLLAQDDDGAGRLYDKIKQAVNRAEFFRPFIFGKAGTDLMKFTTDADLHRREVIPSILVGSHPCTTRAARGPSSYFLAFDEFAHYRNASGANSDEVYEASAPSAARFVRRENGEEHLDSLIVTITSPLLPIGKYYEIYKDGMRQGKDAELPLLIFQSSSAEMAGEEITSKFLRSRHTRDPISWQAEYGGCFLQSSGALVPPDKIEAAFDSGRGNAYGFDPRRCGVTYFWGTDLGFKQDATALAICHWEQDVNGKLLLIYDYIDRMIVGEGAWENAATLEVEAVLDWFEDMNQWLPGTYGCTDQYAGAMFVQLARQRGVDFLELVHLTEGINSEMGYALQGYLNQGVVRFPDIPRFRHELGTVKATYVGKYRLKVEAPNEKGAHDDMVDAVSLAAWRAQKWLLEDGGKSFAFSGQRILPAAEQLRPGDLGVDPEQSTLSQLRVVERMRALSRHDSVQRGNIILSPRLAARRNRF